MSKLSLTKPLFLIIVLIAFYSCKKKYIPKPRGYFRIDFPEKAYQMYQSDCPFIFEYPVYGEIQPDDMSISEPCWINIVFPDYNAKIYISYKPVKENLSELLEDARTFAYKHTIKADAINEKLFLAKRKKVFGTLYDIKGNTASSVQFFLTDSTKHFIRGALYFNAQPNKDSLAPVISFFSKDIDHMIETLEWK